MTRKGLRNQLKSLLFRKNSLSADGSHSPSSGGVQYGYASMEGQMRTLADLAFMLQVNFQHALLVCTLPMTVLKVIKCTDHHLASMNCYGRLLAGW